MEGGWERVLEFLGVGVGCEAGWNLSVLWRRKGGGFGYVVMGKEGVYVEVRVVVEVLDFWRVGGLGCGVKGILVKIGGMVSFDRLLMEWIDGGEMGDIGFRSEVGSGER
ncbi:hypothetical protein Tco_0723049 [Tanacetum coccineum]